MDNPTFRLPNFSNARQPSSQQVHTLSKANELQFPRSSFPRDLNLSSIGNKCTGPDFDSAPFLNQEVYTFSFELCGDERYALVSDGSFRSLNSLQVLQMALRISPSTLEIRQGMNSLL
ncbi:hypothetical protein Acr_26g0000430 [Actinidia rufa]|uniref:Uncharacterized protein n=1 Tax=Actinidia rufa TaxID=165716 RepID=A0A7J0H107_9ERIC|nr:hypothetical protein Acr_26g0000430 [Actinidia rufa]